MKEVLLKKIVIVVGKLTRSGVLWGGEGRGFAGASRDGDGARKFFPSCGGKQEWGKTKLCETRAKTPSFDPILPHYHP